MPKTLIKFSNISKRSASINALSKINVVNECNSIERHYKSIFNVLENNKASGLSTIKMNTDRILESLADSNMANKYTYYPLNIAEKVNDYDDKYATVIIERYCTMVLPYVKDITGVANSINGYKLTDTQKQRVLKEASIYSTCDRIINNHNTISKRFNLEDKVVSNKYNLKYAIESVCSMIDTYQRESYQKMNICIEEMFYIIEKNKIDCNKIDVINSIVEYFLLSSPELTERTYNGFKKCISESSVITEDEASNIVYLSGNREDNAGSSSIKGYIAAYYTSTIRDKDLLETTINNCISSDILDLSYNFDDILEFIIQIYKSDNLISDTDLELVMTNCEHSIASKLVSLINDAELSKDALGELALTLVSKIKEVESMACTYPRMFEMIRHLKAILAVISPYYDTLYDKDNIRTINAIESCTNEIPLSEGQLWRAHNLVTAIRNLDRYLGDKCKAAVNKVIGRSKDGGSPTVREKINGVLFKDPKDEGSLFNKNFKKGIGNVKAVAEKLRGLLAMNGIARESYNPYSYISEESRVFDIILANVPVDDNEVSDVQDSMASICKEFNYILESNYSINNCKIYYTSTPGLISLHLTEIAKFKLEENDIKSIREADHPDIDFTFTLLGEAVYEAELVNTIANKDIESSLFDYFAKGKDMSLNKFDTILECLSLFGTPKSVVEMFADKYTDHKYYSLNEDIDIESETKSVTELIDKYDPEDTVPDNIRLEAYLMTDALLENYDEEDFEEEEDDESDYKPSRYHDTPSDNDDKQEDAPESEESKEEIKKNPYKGLNLKAIKLAVLGLKSKFKSMNQKQQELSKNMDVSFKHLVDGFKNAMISDSRESIIRGSVIPSFSKCVKIGVAAAVALGPLHLNPGIAAVTALGAFATSKRLTHKERLLLLDEIETELDVVEKEISMAEREEDMKRYRALLQYKKNLQRQYQRIRYNVKVGKNLLPGSNAGISGDHDNGY